MNRSAVRVVLGIVIALALILAAGGAFLWWKISGLKEILVRELSRNLGAQVEVTSLDLDLWKGELHAAGIKLINTRPEAPWEKGAISQATIRFHLSDVFASTLPLNVEVSSWNVTLRSYTASTTPPDTTSSPAPASPEDTKRHRVQVTALEAREGNVEIHLADNRQVTIHGVAFQAADNGAGNWNTQVQVGSVTAESLETGSGSVQIRSEADKVVFSNLRLTCGDGLVSGDGEVALPAPHTCHAQLKATDIPISMLVNATWQMKLAGFVSGDVVFNGDDRAAEAAGHLTVAHGKFNVLPMLAKVTSLVGLPDLSDVELDKATSDFSWKSGLLHLSNIDVRKNDVARVSGTLDLNALGQIDGKLKLGLPSSVTAKWPQLQEKVFSTQLEDFNWTDVHVTGTADHLQEDLTARLVSVSLESGGNLIDQATKKASDLLNGFLGK